MLTPSTPNTGQQHLFYTELFAQLEQRDPLIKLANVIDWKVFEDAFSKHYCHDNGRPSKTNTLNCKGSYPNTACLKPAKQIILFYQWVLAQQPKDKNKIYSLHEPHAYAISKGKDHKRYEYGNKVHRLSQRQQHRGWRCQS